MKIRTSQRGFTLLEVIIAITVFVIGVVSLFPLFSHSLRMCGDSEVKLITASLARSKMAEIEAGGFPAAPVNVPRSAFPDPFSNYAYAISWTPLSYDAEASTQPVLYEARLSVSWQGRGGEKTEDYVTYVGKE